MPNKRVPKPKKKTETKRKREVSATPPAQGERTAKGGLQPQDKFSAALVLQRLRGGLLRKIRVADPTAGRVDDFQILTDGRIDAWQVKWDLYPGFISINDLITKDGKKPCLMAQLADGWRRIKELRPNLRVVVHLASNARPSKHDKILPAGSPAGAHLAAFVAECWRPLKAGLIGWDQIPARWPTWMTALETASSLSHDEFVRFVPDCELDFDSRLETDSPQTAEEIARAGEVDEVAQFLYNTVASAEKIVELSRDDLVHRLGWQDAVTFRNTHEFPVDEHSYQPVRQTEQSLETAIQQTTSGYLCLLGTPGSGKSTLLAKTFNQRPERVLRYFAYVPETLNPGSLRGESDNFLHDMILALQRQGINGEGRTIKQTDRLMLLKLWNSQLLQLHREYVDNGRKTIIVIDGLDHIEREQHPHHSLLNDLLAPSDIPDGVVFVLGSQKVAFLQARIQHQLALPGRSVNMDPLTRADAGRVLSANDLTQALSTLQQDRVYNLSAGHPLALAYLVNRLKVLTGPTEIEAFLASATVFTGNIEESYFQYWSSIVDQDTGLIPVLGLVSRIRSYIDLSWLGTWDETEAIARFVKNSSFLFRRETSKRWYFFHNSFRLFLTRRTALDLTGESSEQEDRKFHSILADRCQLATAPEHWKWEELYHRALAQDHQRVLALTDQNLIRSQFFLFRSPSAIHGDLVLASRSLRFVQDGVAAVRIGLVMSEIERRRFALDIHESQLTNILIQSGNVGRAIGWIRDGNRLLIADSNALGHCQELVKAGHREEAKRLFDLVDPSGFTQEPLGMNKEDSQLNSLAGWYFAARIFEPLDVCLETLAAIRFKTADLGRRATEYANDVENAKLHLKLIEQILRGCIYGRDWEDVENLLPQLPQNGQTHHECLILTVEVHLDEGHTDAARRRLEELLSIRAPRSFLGIVRVAESYARLGDRDKVLGYFGQLTRPVLAGRGGGVLNGYDSFEPLFRYDRLAFYCDPATKWTSLVPDDGNREDGGGLFQKALCSVAQIWARAWRREPTAADAFAVEIADLLGFYHRDFRTMENWDFGFEIRYSRTNLYSLLAEACAAHGPHLVETLTKFYDRIWESGEKRYWPLAGQREIIIQLARLSFQLPWCTKWLEKFEAEIELGVTADTYVSESVGQSEAWIAIGAKDRALTRAEKVLRRSFGVADRKDYSLSTWTQLFGEIAPCLPDKGLAAIEWIARCIRGLEHEISGRTVSDAAADLIEVCVRHHPDKAFTLFTWFEANKCVWYEQALRAILKPGLKEPAGDFVLRALFIREVLIPISTKAAPWLLREFLRQLADAWSAADFSAYVQSLGEAINIHVPTETRGEWLLGIAQTITDRGQAPASFGLDPALLRREEPHISSDKLILTDGKIEYLADLAARVRSVEEIARLRELEADQCYFRWNRLVAELAPHLQADALLRIVDLFTDDDHFAEVCEAASNRLVDLGKANEAWELGKKSVEKSQEKTWLRHMDGGPRLSAFLTILRADPAKGRPLLFEAFGFDGPPSRENIQLLLPYLLEPGQGAILWRELENHLRALLEGTDQDAAGPGLIGTQNQPAGDLIPVDLLLHNLGHPASVLKQTAQKTLASLILLDHAPTTEALKKQILPDTLVLPELLEVIVAAASRRPDKCIPFRAGLLAAMDSADFEARTLCLDVAWRCNWSEFATPRPRQPLSAIYQLELPEPSTADVRLIAPYDDLVSLISQGTELPEENLYHRLIEIVRSIDVSGDLDPEAERNMTYRLQSWGLQVRFLKPRVRLVKRGLSRLLGELADAGKIPTTPYSGLPLPFRNFDPYFITASPTPRPTMIPERIKDGNASQYNEEWVGGQINIGDRAPVREPSGWIIVGSKAKFRIANDTRATERTFSVLRPTNSENEAVGWAGKNLFDQTALSSVAEYHAFDGEWDGQGFVIESSLLIEGPGSPFLALHPDVAQQMGWRPQGNGLLAWADRTGQRIVESRWWQDGPVSTLNLHSDVEIADGWYVAMAPTAVAALKVRFGPFSRVIHAQRSAHGRTGLQRGPVFNQTVAF